MTLIARKYLFLFPKWPLSGLIAVVTIRGWPLFRWTFKRCFWMVLSQRKSIWSPLQAFLILTIRFFSSELLPIAITFSDLVWCEGLGSLSVAFLGLRSPILQKGIFAYNKVYLYNTLRSWSYYSPGDWFTYFAQSNGLLFRVYPLCICGLWLVWRCQWSLLYHWILLLSCLLSYFSKEQETNCCLFLLSWIPVSALANPTAELVRFRWLLVDLETIQSTVTPL